jgi:hypothetical protein
MRIPVLSVSINGQMPSEMTAHVQVISAAEDLNGLEEKLTVSTLDGIVNPPPI